MGKPVFNISEIAGILEKRGKEIPQNDAEFYNAFAFDKKIPTKIIKEKLGIVGISQEDLDNDYPEREAQIKLFLEKYDIEYVLKSSEPSPEMSDNSVPLTPEDDTAQELVFSLKDGREIFDKIKNYLYREESIDSSTATFVKDKNVTVHNKLFVKHKNIEIFNEFSMIADDKNNEILAVGKIISKKDGEKTKDFFVADKKNIDYDKFSGRARFNLILIGKECSDFFINYSSNKNFDSLSKKSVYYNSINVKTEEPKISNSELCIDFGTSNTTAGTYLTDDPDKALEANIVEFMDVNNNNTPVKICPTVIYVKKCDDRNNIQYLFGYDALKKVIENDYDTKASVFYEIKKWVNDEGVISIEDENGNVVDNVPKQEIVKAYLDYILECSEDYFTRKFKKLHFTAPIRMKSKFIMALKEMYENSSYEICSEDETIDEAFAIVYDHIYENEILKAQSDENPNSTKNIVVLDCGGGTTDLTTCSYSSRDEKMAKYRHIDVETKFENGNTGFGGNRITFKIMQLLKIKIALNEGNIDKDEYDAIFKDSVEDILDSVDQLADREDAQVNFESLDVYRDFNKLYEKCENFIPTIYADNEKFPTNSDQSKIKRNFYFLWQYAEKVKLAFYKYDEVKVGAEYFDKKIDIKTDDKSKYLFCCGNDDELYKIDTPYSIEISINEIRKLICGDIYVLLSNILPDNVDSYDFCRLSGQSCKINLFKELLKEFITGKKIRKKTNDSAKETGEELKLKCIKGSIQYKASTKHGLCEVAAQTKLPKIIYNVVYTDDDCCAFDENRKNVEILSITKDQTLFRLVIKDMNGNSVNKYDISVDKDDDNKYEKITLDDMYEKLFYETSCSSDEVEKIVTEKIQHIEKEGSDQYGRKYVGIVMPSRDGYGFIVYFVMIQFDGNNCEYSISKGKYHDYEKDDKGYFNGRR